MRVGSTRDRAVGAWPARPAFAIGGEKVLLLDRRLQVTNDSELHPRTAVGIDRDKGRILLLVVDGRSSLSRGYTLVELARMMRRLGAEDALNLDGGGSSTMVGRTARGRRAVLNVAFRRRASAPSPTRIAVKYRRPLSRLRLRADSGTVDQRDRGHRHQALLVGLRPAAR